MKQSGHSNPSEETGTGCPVTSKYGRTPPNKHGGVGRQNQPVCLEADVGPLHHYRWRGGTDNKWLNISHKHVVKQSSINIHVMYFNFRIRLLELKGVLSKQTYLGVV